MAELTPEATELLDQKVFAHVATLMPDGSPQVSPVWIDHDGTNVIFNTAEGRAKTDNLKRDGRVAVSMVDPENPYKSLLVRGEISEITREGADEHIDSLAMKYLGEETYPLRQPGEVRVKVVIKPESVSALG